MIRTSIENLRAIEAQLDMIPDSAVAQMGVISAISGPFGNTDVGEQLPQTAESVLYNPGQSATLLSATGTLAAQMVMMEHMVATLPKEAQMAFIFGMMAR